MNTSYIYRRLGTMAVAATALLMASCGDFLEDYSQDTSYVRGYSDLDELLLGSGYMPTGTPDHIGQSDDYIDEPWYYPYVHLMGDELDVNITSGEGRTSSYDAPAKYFGWYTWQQQVGIDETGTTIRDEDDDWNRIYKHINICNMVIADVDNYEAGNEQGELDKQRIKGESYFLRGAYYFVLANLYGKPYDPSTAATDLAVPIKLTEYIEDEIFQRNTVKEVYDQAESDLLQAENLLDGTTRKSYYRANKASAQLLLSRLYLYKQDFANAQTYAQKVIDDGGAPLADLNTMTADFFLNPDLSETIFTMGNGGARQWVTGRLKDFGITDKLYSLYTDGDLRKTWYVKYDNTYKYAEYVKGGDVSERSRTALSNNFLLRTSEAYLNLAEAAASAGNTSVAQNAVNTLRRKRFSTSGYQDVTASGDELISLIRDERERELCLEGHRWFDLRRYAVSSVLKQVSTIRHNYTTFEYNWRYGYQATQTRYYELSTDDAANTLPIPTEVTDFNIGMQNNERAARPAVETINY